MPSIEGVIPRKVLPVFVLMQLDGNIQDDIYTKMLNGLLEKYYVTNEKNADVEAKLYFAKYNSEIFVETRGIVTMTTCIDDLEMIDTNKAYDSSSQGLSMFFKRISDSEYMSSEVGFYPPIIYFLVSNISEESEDDFKSFKNNQWLRCSTKLWFPCGNKKTEFEHKISNFPYAQDGVFAIPKESDDKTIQEIVDLIFGIRVDSITHSIIIDKVYPQTGMTGAHLMQEYIIGEECTDSHKLVSKRMSFDNIVNVDPINEIEVADGKSIALAEVLATPEEIEFDEEITETSNDEKNADSNASDDYASEAWDD